MALFTGLKFKICLMTFVIWILFLLAGCGSCGGSDIGNPVPPASDPGIDQTSPWDKLELYIKSEFSKNVIPADLSTASWIAGENAPASVINFSIDVYGTEYSHTNVQETGVDESDKVKTDGQYIYISGINTINVVNAAPADSMSVLSKISVHGDVDSIYLHNNILVVLFNPCGDIIQLNWTGLNAGSLWGIGLPYWIPVQRQTGVLIMDVSNPLSPERVNEWIFDGWMVSSRLINNNLHIVQQFLPDLPPLQLTYDGTNKGKAEVIAANERVMESVPLEDLIPYYETIDEQGNPIYYSAPLVAPYNFYYPDDPEGGSLVCVISINLNNTSGNFRSIGFIADASTVYASAKALYIAASKWNPEILDSSDPRYYMTSVYKFSLYSEAVSFKGSGKIKGRILNQFSLGEYNDVLYIATSAGGWGANLRSNIYCLKVINKGLEPIGKLEGLAPGEDIYSARFIGTRGFLVTFEKVDPLFTLDLSDPYHPVVAGELKAPGYSDYIHPLGDDHLITIGKDTIVEGGTVWYQGLKLSIFDISNFAYPRLLHSELVGDRGTTSEALSNHKAFIFQAENNLLAIPVDLFEHITEPEHLYSFGEYTFSGLYIYRISIDEGFEYLGRISADLADGWLRGLFIEDAVYSVNEEAARSAYIEDIEGSISELIFSNSD